MSTGTGAQGGIVSEGKGFLLLVEKFQGPAEIDGPKGASAPKATWEINNAFDGNGTREETSQSC
jgi:hypothetical protein